MNRIIRFFKLSATLVLACGLLSSCETFRLGLDNKKWEQNLSKNSICLFTVRLENRHKPSFRPSINSIVFSSLGGAKKGTYWAKNKDVTHSGAATEFQISIDLAADTYKIEKIYGGVTPDGLGAGFVMGKFAWPLGGRFTLPPNSVTYIGHIEMILREAKDGERKAGGLVPLLLLIEQAASGVMSATIDVNVKDKSSVDIPAFVKRYPALQKHKIGKSILRL